MLANYLVVMRSPAWLGFTLVGVAMYWALFAFLSESSFVFSTLYGLSPTAFGIAVSIITSGFLVGMLASRRALPRLGIQRTLTLATSIAAGSGLTMLALALAGVDHLAAMLAPQFVFVFAHGLSQSAWQAGSVAPFPGQAGSAAALTGFVQNVVAAGVSLLTGVLHDGSELPLVGMVAAGGLAALLVARTLVRRHGGVDTAERAVPAAAPGVR
jgi:DHA1 family bicyclomycin/chloramphenicol resistance-like MFS transporter